MGGNLSLPSPAVITLGEYLDLNYDSSSSFVQWGEGNVESLK